MTTMPRSALIPVGTRVRTINPLCRDLHGLPGVVTSVGEDTDQPRDGRGKPVKDAVWGAAMYVTFDRPVETKAGGVPLLRMMRLSWDLEIEGENHE